MARVSIAGYASQSQGGGLPFSQTTVLVLPGGTTTVVLAGGAGLELLMHPANTPAAIIALRKTFIWDSPLLR